MSVFNLNSSAKFPFQLTFRHLIKCFNKSILKKFITGFLCITMHKISAFGNTTIYILFNIYDIVYIVFLHLFMFAFERNLKVSVVYANIWMIIDELTKRNKVSLHLFFNNLYLQSWFFIQWNNIKCVKLKGHCIKTNLA